MPTTTDIIKELPTGMATVARNIGNFFVSSGQASFRGFAALGGTLTGEPLTPSTPFQKALYGTEKAITTRSFGAELGLDEKGKAAPFVGFALAAADLIPGGKITKSTAIGLLKNVNKVDDAFRVLKQMMGVSDDVAKKFAPFAAKVTDTKELSTMVDDVVRESQDVARMGRKALGVVRERGFITSVKETFPDASSKVAGQYIPRSTDELARQVRETINTDLRGAIQTAKTGTDDKAVATASELINYFADAAANAPDTAVKAAMEDQMADVANEIARKLTEQGRSIQAASILGKMTPEGQVRFAAREIQKYNEMAKASKGPLVKEIPELTVIQADNIVKQMKLISDMPDGIEKAKTFQKLQDEIKELVPSPLMKKITTVWKAGLLTGIKTSGLNIFANISHTTTETIKQAPAVIVDSVASLFTGKRTTTMTLRGTLSGTEEGFKKGWSYFRTGFDERNIAQKLDYTKVNFGKSAFARGIQKYEEIIFRILGSEDQPFYYGAKARSLYDQALAQGKNIGVKGQDLADFANDLVKNPTDDMLKYAAIDAETVVFQNKTALGKAAKAIQDIPVVGEFIVPFSRTPSAVATQIINYSPIGILKTVVENIGKGKFDQRLFAQGMGRGITGTGFLYLGTKLFDNDLVTLDFPKDEREQKLWELEGRKPNSIKVGDKWRTVQTLGPVGSSLIVGAHFQRKFKETGSLTSGIAQSFVGGLKSFTEQTFLQGLRNVTEAINDPDRFADAYFGNLTASFVPTISADIARAKDLTERRARTVIERVEARIPFLREALEPKVDVLGKEVKVGGNILETMADPTRPSKDVSTPLVEELRRLTTAGFKVSPTLLGDKNGYKSLTLEQNTDLWKRAGEIISNKLENLTKNQKYLDLPDDKRAKVIEDFVEKSKLIARAEKVLELTSGLSGSNLKAELSKQKEGGLMTREVYNKYLELK